MGQGGCGRHSDLEASGSMGLSRNWKKANGPREVDRGKILTAFGAFRDFSLYLKNNVNI